MRTEFTRHEMPDGTTFVKGLDTKYPEMYQNFLANVCAFVVENVEYEPNDTIAIDNGLKALTGLKWLVDINVIDVYTVMPWVERIENRASKIDGNVNDVDDVINE